MSSKTPAVASGIHPPVGTLIDGGSLELVEVLGVGGYGVVYRAVDIRSPNPRSYAVKCLVSQSHQTHRQRQIHIREIALHQIASSHPGVITLHRIVEDYNRTYIVMDYAPDHDLFTQILHSCRYLGDDTLIKDVFLQLLDAVEYCHSLGIYHRDLKPENVLCFDDGLRIAITDFGLATTDKLSEEFRTGSVYHMSPGQTHSGLTDASLMSSLLIECQGGHFAITGNYSPMFNDIWSLGIILLNLTTGRNPWKSATPDDQTFQAYLRDPLGFLPTVLPISLELNDILIRMLEVDWRERITLPELRLAIEDVNSFYSEGVVFEGSMARCPWESGMDIDSDSSEDTKGSELPANSEQADPVSRWSKESSSDIVFARHSNAGSASSYGVPWTEYSSCAATWAFESPSSSTSDDETLKKPDQSTTPVTPVSGESSPPITPNSLDMVFGRKAKMPPRKALTIDTNFAQPMFYNLNASMASTKTSIMQTAVEYDPYSSSFFLASPTSNSYTSINMPVSMLPSVTSLDDKQMDSPTIWASSATEMSSPSVYSSGSSSTDSMKFTRSTTPSPDTVWSGSGFRAEVECLPPSPPSQTSSPVCDVMTNVLSPSRASVYLPKRSYDSGDVSPSARIEIGTATASTKPKATSIFNPIKFFPRVSSPTPSASQPTTNTGSQPRHTSEPPTTPPCDKTPHAPPFPTPWSVVSPQGESSRARPSAQRDRRISTFRSPRNWFTPGKFFASTGAH